MEQLPEYCHELIGQNADIKALIGAVLEAVRDGSIFIEDGVNTILFRLELEPYVVQDAEKT